MLYTLAQSPPVLTSGGVIGIDSWRSHKHSGQEMEVNSWEALSPGRALGRRSVGEQRWKNLFWPTCEWLSVEPYQTIFRASFLAHAVLVQKLSSQQLQHRWHIFSSAVRHGRLRGSSSASKRNGYCAYRSTHSAFANFLGTASPKWPAGNSHLHLEFSFSKQWVASTMRASTRHRPFVVHLGDGQIPLMALVVSCGTNFHYTIGPYPTVELGSSCGLFCSMIYDHLSHSASINPLMTTYIPCVFARSLTALSEPVLTT